MTILDDFTWMSQAIEQAKIAGINGEVPIGAVLVKDNKLLAQSHNQPIKTNDPSAHAEISCMRIAGEVLKNYRLPNTTLYVTLEPCAMCAGALIQARVSRLVFAAHEPRSGAIDSVFQLFKDNQLNHNIDVSSGLMSEESANLLKKFFKRKRAEQKKLTKNSDKVWQAKMDSLKKN